MPVTGDALSVGILLLDPDWRFVSANDEAVRVLGFPGINLDRDGINGVVTEKIAPALGATGKPPFLLKSGQRTYECEATHLASCDADQAGQIALILKRSRAGLDFGRLTERFSLTRREFETIRLLVSGNSTDEIASAMTISPNTVKVYMRLIMAKMRVANRAAIVSAALRFS